MKLVNERIENFQKIPNTKMPALTPDMENDLNGWAESKYGINGHSVLEKILTIIDDYKFDQKYSKKLGDLKFELKTVDGRPIQIDLWWGSMDDYPRVIIKDGNLERRFDVLVNQRESWLEVILTRTIELDTKFEQYYSKYSANMYKQEGERTIALILNNPDLTDDYENFYLVDDAIKEEFKTKSFPSIMDVYNFVVEKVFPTVHTFEIRISGKDKYTETDRITVLKGAVKEIKLTKTVNGNTCVIKENFENPNTDQELTFASETEQLNNIQKEMQRKLKQEN